MCSYLFIFSDTSLRCNFYLSPEKNITWTYNLPLKYALQVLGNYIGFKERSSFTSRAGFYSVKVAETNMRCFTRSKYSRSLVHKKYFSLI